MRIICQMLAMLVLLSACTLFRGHNPSPGKNAPAWQDMDSQNAAVVLVDQMLQTQWYTEFLASRLRKPLYAMGDIEAPDTFPKASLSKALENELLAAGVHLVAKRDYSGSESAADNAMAVLELARNTGADFMLSTKVEDNPTANPREACPSYSISLMLTDVASGTNQWSLTLACPTETRP